MQCIDLEVIRQGIIWLEQDQPVWLCTVLNTYGSAPRAPGAMMVVTTSGRYRGSLSGGCVEEDFLHRLERGELRQPSQLVRYGAASESTITLPCGGTLEILVEYFPPSEQSRAHLDQIQEALVGDGQWLKSVTFPLAAQPLQPSSPHYGPKVIRSDSTISLYLGAITKIVIAGLSSVSEHCAHLAKMLGFEVVVCEPREEVRQNYALNELHIEPIFPAIYLERGGAHIHTAVIAATHDPRIDDLTLMEAVRTSAFYIGAMGSERTSQARRERLYTTGELTSVELERIHAPIGLPIGSKTPAEIAIAIMADIIRVKNSR